MASFDQCGGCACGLYRECQETCEHNDKNKLSCYHASLTLQYLIRCTVNERKEVLQRLEEIMYPKLDMTNPFAPGSPHAHLTVDVNTRN